MAPRRRLFAHHNLLVGAHGQALSKRDRTLSIAALREEGIEALAVASYSALIGTSDPVVPHANLDELARGFDFSKLSRAPARFDPNELRLLNAKLLHVLPFSVVADRLAAMGVAGGEAFWDAVKGNLAVLADAGEWWQVVEGPLQPVIADADLCRKAAGLLPPEPWDGTTWSAWSSAVKQATGAKGKELVLAAPARAHRPRAWTRAQTAFAVNRARPRCGAARRQAGVSSLIGARRVPTSEQPASALS